MSALTHMSKERFTNYGALMRTSAIAFDAFYALNQPTLRRTSALVTEWSQKIGHLDKLSC